MSKENKNFGTTITGAYFKTSSKTDWAELRGFVFRTQEDLDRFKQAAEAAEIGGRLVAYKCPAEWKEENEKSPDFQFAYESPEIVEKREAQRKDWAKKNGKSFGRQQAQDNDII